MGEAFRFILAAHSTTSERAGLLAPKPLGLRLIFAGGCIATLCSPTGGVYYQYIFFFHFLSAKIQSFFESTKQFQKKFFCRWLHRCALQSYGWRILSIHFFSTFSAAKIHHQLNFANFGIYKYRNIYSHLVVSWKSCIFVPRKQQLKI